MESVIDEEKIVDKEDEKALRMEYAKELGKFSLELEEKREQSILNQSGQMLTAFSLFSAAILMAVPIVIEHSNIPAHQVMYLAELAFIPLIISLALAIIAQWRFRYQTMLNATEFENCLYRNREEYQERADYDWQWICQLSDVQKSKKANNDKRVLLVKLSMALFLASVGMLVIGNMMFYVLYT